LHLKQNSRLPERPTGLRTHETLPQSFAFRGPKSPVAPVACSSSPAVRRRSTVCSPPTTSTRLDGNLELRRARRPSRRPSIETPNGRSLHCPFQPPARERKGNTRLCAKKGNCFHARIWSRFRGLKTLSFVWINRIRLPQRRCAPISHRACARRKMREFRRER